MSKTVNDSSLSFETTSKTPVVRFLASLSDGRTVIQDDRPGQRHAWVRLSKWMKKNPTISITNMRLQKHGGVDISMPANMKGYFLGNKQSAVWRGGQANYIGIGYYDGHMVNISWNRQPNFDHVSPEERTVAKAGFFLIRNP